MRTSIRRSLVLAFGALLLVSLVAGTWDHVPVDAYANKPLCPGMDLDCTACEGYNYPSVLRARLTVTGGLGERTMLRADSEQCRPIIAKLSDYFGVSRQPVAPISELTAAPINEQALPVVQKRTPDPASANPGAESEAQGQEPTAAKPAAPKGYCHPDRLALAEKDPSRPYCPSQVVALALSGGGSRAANFSLAVMHELERHGILEHVNFISSTSGGGLTGAYYALHGEAMPWEQAKELFRTPFRDRLLWATLRSLPRWALTHYDRTDVMADVFDQLLFHGATFGDLDRKGAWRPGIEREAGGRPGARRPIWIANATAVSGERAPLFQFSEDSFAIVGSRLDEFPISRAVMASAAFPAGFNTVTLRDHRSSPPKEKSAIVERPHIVAHLIDGGPVDNLGVESALQYVQHVNREANKDTLGDRPCLIMVVDAYPAGVTSRLRYRADPRSSFDYFIDSNVSQAFDAALVARRDDFLTRAGLGELASYLVPNKPVPRRHTSKAWYPRTTGDRRVPVSAKGIPDKASLASERLGTEAKFSARSHFACTIWHIAIDNIAVIETRAVAEPKKDEHYEYLIDLLRVNSQIATDFNLTGPRGCSARFLQDSLYAGASVLVSEDHVSREAACRWMTEHRLPHDEAKCRARVTRFQREEFSLPIEPSAARSVRGRLDHEEVRCFAGNK